MLRLFISFAIVNLCFGYEKDMTFTVQAGKTDCFYQKALPNQVIDVEYQVIDATHGELDISFQLSDPHNRVIVADYKKPENSHQHTAAVEGDYRFCFDNTFSTFSQKTVFFDLLIGTNDDVDLDYDDDKEMEIADSAQTYMMRVRDISESVSKVRDHVAAAMRLQELLSAHEARDRNVAEEMCSRVLSRSLIQIILMIIIGLTQVVFVKSLFDDRGSAAHFKKLLPNFSNQ